MTFLLRRVISNGTSIKCLLIIILLWGFLIYIFTNKLNTNTPSTEYEQLRRRIRQNTQEMWNFFSSELDKLRKKSIQEGNPIEIRSILEIGAERKRSLISDIDNLQLVDGYEKWRQQEAADLSDLVQARLTYIQNPQDCKKSKKIICEFDLDCGYGCQLHRIVNCFIIAYSTERKMILKSKFWYYHKSGWDKVFQPVSETCSYSDVNLDQAIMPSLHHLNFSASFNILSLVCAIPEDLAPRLIRLHGDPIVWWIGQFLKYLLKPKRKTQEMIDSGLEKLGFKKPIVGIHVRRTDKVGTEASFHGIEEYMSYVEDYFLTLECNMTQKIKRRVFIATDDPRVIDEARRKYENYEIIGDPEVARMANVSTRYTVSSLNGIILDIHLLSICDYLVCTFSSRVCRVAYEIMNTFYPDATNRFRSLDDVYYYIGQTAHNRIAVMTHKPTSSSELSMQVGDIVGIAGNHWNGFSKGKNVRTNHVGLFPSFKTNEKIETVSLPTYPDAHISGEKK